MASCASCGAEGVGAERACPSCGARSLPELELDLKARPAPKPVAPKKRAEAELSLELAVDPRTLVAQRAAEHPASQGSPARHAPSPAMAEAPRALSAAAMSAPVDRSRAMAPAAHGALAEGVDVASDARVLADFGEPPESWVMAPTYAWKVMKRQRELRAALGARRAEADLAARELQDALVSFAERIRPAAEKQAAYAVALEDLQRAEDVLRSRDKVLAAEQDAQKARLYQVDARLVKLEEDLAQAHTEEMLTAQELSAAQGALEREETKLKRADVELRTAQGRDPDGTGP